MGTEVKGCLTVNGPPGTDTVGPGFAGELRRNRPDSAGFSVDEGALSRPEVALVEQG